MVRGESQNDSGTRNGDRLDLLHKPRQRMDKANKAINIIKERIEEIKQNLKTPYQPIEYYNSQEARLDELEELLNKMQNG